MTEKILFLCGHNAGRSQMAQAIFNNLNKNPEFEAISAGTNIAHEINQTFVETLKEINIDISNKNIYFPKKITKEMVDETCRICTMGCNVQCESIPEIKNDEDWDLDDPAGQDIAKVSGIRDQIVVKVKELLKELNTIKL